MQGIQKSQALEPEQEASQRQTGHLEHEPAELNQLPQQCQEQDEKEISDSIQYNSLQSRLDILEGSVRWNKF